MQAITSLGTSTISESGRRTPSTVYDLQPEVDPNDTGNLLGLHRALQAAEVRCDEQQNTIRRLQTELDEANKRVNELHSKQQQYSENSLARIQVGLRAAAFSDRYVQMMGTTGRVSVATTLGGWETFELVRHYHGMVSFKSTCYPEVYLSANGSAVLPGILVKGGGGTVSCQRHCGDSEKFWIHECEHGRVGIEPILFPGRFLRLDGNKRDSLNLQGVKSWWENFYLVVVRILPST